MAAVAGHGVVNTSAFRFLEELADGIGGRVTGSPEARQAVAWGVTKMKAMGLSNVHTETWRLPIAWSRVSADAELVAPVRRRLHVDSMGWVGSTPRGGATAEVLPVNINQLEREMQSATRWSGKVLLSVHDGEAASRATLMTTIPAFLAAAHRAGAVAVIGSDGLSVAAGMNLTHTADNAVFFCPERAFCDIPIVSMPREEHLLLARLIARGEAVRLRIDVQNQVGGPADSDNVLGEIRGREHPEQIVVVGAHLDSWDLGQGAVDNGFGVAAVLAAAEAIVRSGHAPRRTIRFVLFTGEEQGLLGSRAYVQRHAAELANHLGAVVMDTGHGPAVGLSLGRPDLVSSMREFTGAVSGVAALTVNGNSCGTDCLPFIEVGLPGINVVQSTPDFAAILHSAADTLDKVDQTVLARNSTIMALTAFWIADRQERWAAPLPR